MSAVTLPGPATSTVAPDVALDTVPITASTRRRAVRALVLALLAAVAAVGAVQVIRVVRRPPEVMSFAVKRADVTRMLAVTGRVEAVQTVVVSPQFSGWITEIVRHEGDRVKKGELLARLADTSARSNVLQQEAALTSRQHDLAQAQRDLARTTSLAV